MNPTCLNRWFVGLPLAVVLLQGRRQPHPLSGKQQPPMVTTNPGVRVKQKGDPGAGRSTPTAAITPVEQKGAPGAGARGSAPTAATPPVEQKGAPWVGARGSMPTAATPPVEQKGGPGAGARGLPTAATPPSEQLLRQERSKPTFSRQGTGPAASKTELNLLSAGDDESSSTGPGTRTAAAEAASAKQLVCEMHAQIAALDMEKTQLSAHLSAAHSSIQELRDAEAFGSERTVMLGKPAEEDVGQQHQLASEVTKVGHCSFSCWFMHACIPSSHRFIEI